MTAEALAALVGSRKETQVDRIHEGQANEMRAVMFCHDGTFVWGYASTMYLEIGDRASCSLRYSELMREIRLERAS